MSSRLRHRGAALLVIVLIALLAVPSAGVAATTKEKLDQARKHAAELDRRIASAEKELARIEKELDALEVELTAAAEELAEAEQIHVEATNRWQDAADRSERADRELEDARAELADNDELLRDVARDAYKRGIVAASPEVAMIEIVSAGDAEGLSDRLHYLHHSMGERTAALQSAEALVVKVDVLADRARDYAEEQERLLVIAEEAREEAAAAHAKLEGLLAETSVRLARQDELIASLASDRELAGVRIEELEQRLEQERIERERRERERREREARERAERERKAAAAAKSSSGGGGGGSVSSRSAGGGLVTVGGITVAASLAPQLEALLNAARADGIVLGGHGYRSPEATARLRKINGCPDVYKSPASSCRVPTARPGSSEHEKGLAVDFTYKGATICFPRPGSRCSGNAGFDWLKANAHKYGLKNLKTEAWHWSTTGR